MFEVGDSISGDLLDNFVVGFCLPSGFKEHVLITSNSIMENGFFLKELIKSTYGFNITSLLDVCIQFELVGNLNNHVFEILTDIFFGSYYNYLNSS